MGEIRIETLDGTPEIVQEIRNLEQVHQNWYYAPRCSGQNVCNGEVWEHPYPRRVFDLPFTHRIRHATDDTRRYYA